MVQWTWIRLAGTNFPNYEEGHKKILQIGKQGNKERMKEYKRNMIDYMMNKALADQAKALASLDLLLEQGVGIGDHSTGDYWSNVDDALDTLVDAEDRWKLYRSILSTRKMLKTRHIKGIRGVSSTDRTVAF